MSYFPYIVTEEMLHFSFKGHAGGYAPEDNSLSSNPYMMKVVFSDSERLNNVNQFET